MLEITIREIRHKKKLTLEQLSRLSGVSVAHISEIERGYKIPTIDIIVKIAKALNCEPQDLFNY
jgi:transcriptional regulator with XRE-family HTH domain